MTFLDRRDGRDGGGGGVSRPGGGTSSNTGGGTTSFIPFLENGGFGATAYVLFTPTQTLNGGSAYIGTFSPTDYNDITDGSAYFYRQEDIIPHRVPTVRRVVLTYRNLGAAILTVNVSAVDDNGVTNVESQTKTIGNASADGTLLTAFFDITITGFRPQLSYIRQAGAGPVSIIRASLIGEIEEVTL